MKERITVRANCSRCGETVDAHLWATDEPVKPTERLVTINDLPSHGFWVWLRNEEVAHWAVQVFETGLAIVTAAGPQFMGYGFLDEQGARYSATLIGPRHPFHL